MIDKFMYFIIGGLDRWIKWINDKLIIKPKKKKKSKPSQEDLFNGS
jgi:hypothetical protein